MVDTPTYSYTQTTILPEVTPESVSTFHTGPQRKLLSDFYSILTVVDFTELCPMTTLHRK